MRASVLLFASCLPLLLLPLLEAALPQAVRTQFVKSTNAVRSNLALGRLANRNGTKLPAGRNVYQLLYSLQLEAQAQKLVDTCVYKFPEIAGVAGNAIKLAGIKPIDATTAVTVVNTWLNQLKAGGLQSLALTARDNTTLRGFVRMAWATSREIGCAMKQCPSISGTLAVCLYSRAVVKVGSLIYGRGTGCKKNADCTSYAGSTCTVTTGLCYSKPPVPLTTTPAPTTPKPTTKPTTTLLTTTTTVLPPTTSTSTLKPTTTLLTTILTSTPTSTSTSTLKPTTTLLTTTTTVLPTSTSTLKPTSTSTSTSTTTKPTTTATPGTGPTTPPSDPQMTDALRKLSIDLHNQFRSSAALGTLDGKNGAKFPQASGMAAAVWSDFEWNFAYNSVLAGCIYSSGGSYNVQVWPSYLSPEKALNDSIYAWAATLSQYDPSNLVISGTSSLGTHLIWNEPSVEFKVGCAVKYCPNGNTRVACSYRPYGNDEGKPIYQTGTPCSTCAAAQQCVAGKGLCTYVNETIIPNLTDAQRMISLNWHNTNRSSVAKGQAVNKNGTTIPPAKNMLKMTWSKTCESLAKQAVAPCVWAHSPQNNTGQNLYFSGAYITMEWALEQSVRLWYDELVNDGQNSLTLDAANAKHFTQVVWANSHELGCAVAYCPTLQGTTATQVTFVSCQYSPAGNVIGQVVYQAGTTCSACPSGSTCETASGLCKKTGVADIHN